MAEEDALSPTSIVLNFLKSKGVKPDATNIRTVLEQNARDPGYIPGLSNSPEADSSPRVGSGKGSVAGKIEGGGSSGGKGPNTPVDSSNPSVLPSERGGTQTTSAAPGADEQDVSSGFSLPGALGAAILGGGLYGASRLRGGGSSNIDAPVGVPGARSDMQLGGPPDRVALPSPDMSALPPPPGQLEIAMQKAMQLGGPEAVPQLNAPSGAIPMPDATSGPAMAMPAPQPAGPPEQLRLPAPTPPLGDVQPYQPMAPGVQPPPPDMVSGMRVGPSTPDASVLNEANIRGNLVPPPQIPLRPRVPPVISGRPVPNLGELLRGIRVP